jgi:hypothetical protein
VKPIRLATPEAPNSTYIDCNRRIQALRALGEDENGYGRVIATKILRAFPNDMCRRWIVHAKRKGVSEGDILQLMDFLGDEVDGTLTTQNIRGETPSYLATSPRQQRFAYKPSQQGRYRRTRGNPNRFVHSVNVVTIRLRIVQESRISRKE